VSARGKGKGHPTTGHEDPEREQRYITLIGAILLCVKITEQLYRVIHKSLRDFRPLRSSSRDGHAEGEHVNRGRDTPSFCLTLQVLDMLTSEGS